MEKGIPIYKEIVAARNTEQPIWEKKCLTLDEAATYFGIGTPKLRMMIKEKRCPFILYMGDKPFIIREKLEKYLDKRSRI